MEVIFTLPDNHAIDTCEDDFFLFPAISYISNVNSVKELRFLNNVGVLYVREYKIINNRRDQHKLSKILYNINKHTIFLDFSRLIKLF